MGVTMSIFATTVSRLSNAWNPLAAALFVGPTCQRISKALKQIAILLPTHKHRDVDMHLRVRISSFLIQNEYHKMSFS